MGGPASDPRWSARATTQPAVGQHTSTRLPPGYRWIAVRPGAPPPTRRRRRLLGPTPRYAVIPRWGLVDRVDAAAMAQTSQAGPAPAAAPVRATLSTVMVVLGIAVLVHVVRYVLLIINRSTLLNPVVAVAAVWLGVVASVAAIVAVTGCAIVLTQWLIARRAAAFRHIGRPEPRPGWALWAGCLVPLVNVAWAPVYVIELATIEDHYARLRKPILLWWTVWIASTAVSIFAVATSRAQDSQGIGDNTLTMMFAYLLAMLTVAAAGRIFEGFERKPIERPAHRWVVVGDDRPPAPASLETVELEGQEPAA